MPDAATTRYGAGSGLETENVGLESVGGATSVKEVSVESSLSSVGGGLSHDHSGGVCIFM